MGYFRKMKSIHGNNVRNHLSTCQQKPHKEFIFCCKNELAEPLPTQKPTTQKPTTQKPTTQSPTTQSLPIESNLLSSSKLACQKYQTLQKNLPIRFKKCKGNNIVFGVNTDVNEFPHMVAIGYEKEKEGSITYDFDCGGSLISEKFVLTAAHCANKRNQIPKIVRLGKVKKA